MTRTALLTAVAAAALVATVPAGPAAAASPVQFGRIQYDSPGTDDRSNTSLNAEYVVLKNTGSTTVNLRGWTLRDASNHVYAFPTTSNVYLGAGRTLTVHTGKGTNSSTHRYWGSAAYVWTNSGDTAVLRTASGAQADACSWSSTGAGYKYC